jgi:hypothetical protein
MITLRLYVETPFLEDGVEMKVIEEVKESIVIAWVIAIQSATVEIVAI